MSRLSVLAVFLVSFAFGCGAPGDDASCTVVDNGDGTYAMTCPDGSSVVFSDGGDGTAGQDGESCTVVGNGDGTYTMTCPDGTQR